MSKAPLGTIPCSLVCLNVTFFQVGSDKFLVKEGEMHAVHVPLTELLLSVPRQSLGIKKGDACTSPSHTLFFFPLGSKSNLPLAHQVLNFTVMSFCEVLSSSVLCGALAGSFQPGNVCSEFLEIFLSCFLDELCASLVLFSLFLHSLSFRCWTFWTGFLISVSFLSHVTFFYLYYVL